MFRENYFTSLDLSFIICKTDRLDNWQGQCREGKCDPSHGNAEKGQALESIHQAWRGLRELQGQWLRDSLGGGGVSLRQEGEECWPLRGFLLPSGPGS